MFFEMSVERALCEICADPTGSLQVGKSSTSVRRTAIANGKHMGDDAEAVGLDGSGQTRERVAVPRRAVVTSGGQQRELGGDVADGGCGRPWGREQGFLAAVLNPGADDRIEAAERRPRHECPGRKLEGAFV